ncbi:Small-conductance mechanosensitive channel [Stratiformator vulcanicus]|uniref:Small-conductance mechanosensitive channel n=2 Tax=Stratiformator vulcanicus TaxID=2527980 RepID=A0A517QZK6_9PLAN|nr:Small-conductance mechanosensitive channel [Stratiformator vulcanicus]
MQNATPQPDATEQSAGSATAPEGPSTEEIAADPFGIVRDSLSELVESTIAHTPLLIAGLVVLILTWLTSKVATAIYNRTISRSRMRVGLVSLLRQLLQIGIWIAGFLIAAVVMFPGMTPARALALLGVGSVAIGFAFKDIFENFFAGMLILWRFPFDPGDFIECEGITGKVEAITIRLTLVRQPDGQIVTVPNGMLFKNPVRVLTERNTRRISLSVGLPYDCDLSQAKGIILEAVKKCSTVKGPTAVRVLGAEFGGSSINFDVLWWTSTSPMDERESRDEVLIAIKTALDEAGIEIPFPQRTLTFGEPVSVLRNDEGQDG